MREICMSGSTRGRLMSDPAGMVRGSRVRRNVRSPNGIVHQRSTLRYVKTKEQVSELGEIPEDRFEFLKKPFRIDEMLGLIRGMFSRYGIC
jgi:hypothetical protein